MKTVLKFVLILCCIFSLQNITFATKFANIQYDIPIDYSKIDERELAKQANLFFEHFWQIKDEDARKKYLQPLLNRYSVLSQISPEEPLYFTRLAILYDEMGNNQMAKSNFYKATNLIPDYPYASYSFGNYYYKRGAYRKALKQYNASKNIKPPYSYDRYMKIGSIYEKLGNFSNAVLYYKLAYSEKQSSDLYNKILLLDDLKSKNMLYH